ncbi:Poly(U)-binding-splicing factor PUF60 [Smittium mucronatum]|uniref:Poly(U)-binding-splicing factor PUF60 n=1 Tax=Smittium mucronatum TaxID=133383 RepID=A0A1R0H2E4_9FUNG|nr:Poly(U)-binding-splicing factor PUF60 [Smittium mucronatum]
MDNHVESGNLTDPQLMHSDPHQIDEQELGTNDDDKEAELSAESKLKLINARDYIKQLSETKFKVVVETIQPGIVNPGLMAGMDVRSLSLLSRIYVGSINFEITEQHIRKVFTEFGFIKHISMSSDPLTGRHKGFGFVEYDVPESANMALEAMDGTMLGGRQLKVGRPNNYSAAIACILVPPPDERIFVANVNEAVTETDLESIFSSFGPVKKCILAPNMQTRGHKGYGFIEYESAEIATLSISAMNGFNLGNMVLRVRKCVVGGPLGDGMSALASLPVMVIPETLLSNINAPANPPSSNEPNPQQQQQQHSNSLASINGQTDSYFGGILRLENVCDVDEVDSDLPQDIFEESTKFGPVTQVFVSKLSANDGFGERVIVFVEYEKKESANDANKVFDGRWFGGRQLRASVTSRQTLASETKTLLCRYPS